MPTDREGDEARSGDTRCVGIGNREWAECPLKFLKCIERERDLDL